MPLLLPQLFRTQFLVGLVAECLQQNRTNVVNIMFPLDKITRLHCPFQNRRNPCISGNHLRKRKRKGIHHTHLEQEIHHFGFPLRHNNTFQIIGKDLGDIRCQLAADLSAFQQAQSGLLHRLRIAFAFPVQPFQLFFLQLNVQLLQVGTDGFPIPAEVFLRDD